MRSTTPSLLSSSGIGPPRRQKSSSQISTTTSLKSLETEVCHGNLQVANNSISTSITSTSQQQRPQQPNTYASCYQVFFFLFFIGLSFCKAVYFDKIV